jgi:hypothetical protein
MEKTILKQFGPSVFKTSIPEVLIQKLNDYVDLIVKNEEKSVKLDFGKSLAGNVKQEFKLEVDFMKSSGWGSHLMKESSEWIFKSTEDKLNNKVGKKITKFQMIESWIVRQFENEYNPAHYHHGHISGVGYLKVPDDLGKTFQKNKQNSNGHLQLLHGSKQFLSNPVLDIKPKVGDFYFFPAYLTHTVYPFINKTQERRSISFNAYIDDSIFYG